MSGRGPLYRHIEFCRNAETLWGKLQEGRWEWLGMHSKGQFVLGRPSRARDGLQIPPLGETSTAPGAKEGQHGVKTYKWMGWPKSPPRALWFTSAAEARTAFEKEVERLEDVRQNPILARVLLYEDGRVAGERFIAQTPPSNYQ